MLTQVLAARLPPNEFLVVRVVLRDVAADADLQSQIEHAIRAATGENLAWPDLHAARRMRFRSCYSMVSTNFCRREEPARLTTSKGPRISSAVRLTRAGPSRLSSLAVAQSLIVHCR